MVAILKEMLNGVQVDEPIAAGPMQIFGLRLDCGGRLVYQTMDDALASNTLEVTEVTEEGQVPALMVTNNNDTMVLMIAGEQLVGAKQNRVLNASIMVPGKSKTKIPVSCVEGGRWRYRSRAFRSSGSSSHYFLRKMVSSSTSMAYRRFGRPSSDQGEVWREVSRKMGAMHCASPSQALEQTYEDYGVALEKILRSIRLPERCCGVVFAFGGRIAGVDLFDKPETLHKMLPKLAKSYAIDSLEVEALSREPHARAARKRSWWRPWRRPTGEEMAAVDRETVEKWLRASTRARFERFDSPGLGEDIRIESDETVGAGLVVDQWPVHVELFAEKDTRPETSA